MSSAEAMQHARASIPHRYFTRTYALTAPEAFADELLDARAGRASAAHTQRSDAASDAGGTHTSFSTHSTAVSPAQNILTPSVANAHSLSSHLDVCELCLMMSIQANKQQLFSALTHTRTLQNSVTDTLGTVCWLK